MGKRIFDVIAASLGVVICFPLLVLIAVLVKLDSPGPVLYRGWRIGYRKVPFQILKFRTMCVNAEALGTTTALADPRITRIGHFLRKTKLDELPQLFNVIAGTMSLVGPRPEVQEHVAEYSAEEQIILQVRPGITDLSSIRFYNLAELLGSENAHEVFIQRYRQEKNRLRIEYVNTQSFRGDISILWRTFLRMFRRS